MTPVIAAMSLVQPWLLKRIIDETRSRWGTGGAGDPGALLPRGSDWSLPHRGDPHAGHCVGRDSTHLENPLRALHAHARSSSSGSSIVNLRAASTRLDHDLDSLGDALSGGIVTIVLDLLMIIGTVGAMLWLDWQLSIVMLLMTPLLLGVLELLRRQMKKLYLAIRDALAGINAYLAERVDGVSVIQLFGAEETTNTAFEQRNRRFRDLVTLKRVRRPDVFRGRGWAPCSWPSSSAWVPAGCRPRWGLISWVSSLERGAPDCVHRLPPATVPPCAMLREGWRSSSVLRPAYRRLMSSSPVRSPRLRVR